jgi:mono/diheme cytochrome c family protein
MKAAAAVMLGLASLFAQEIALGGVEELPQVPKAWDDAAVAELEVPLANPEHSPIHVSAELYYRIPVRVIYRSYPAYYPRREPAGYQEWLNRQEPEVAFDPSRLHTREDWVKAGETVFNAPTSFNPVFFSAADLRSPAFYKETGMPVAKDGTIPFARWVIRRKGQPELGSMGCATCHTRVLPGGAVVPGAQGNNPGDREGARMLRMAALFGDRAKVLERTLGFARQFEMPWLPDDPNRQPRQMTLEALIAAGEAIPAGVTARANTSMILPPQIPDLIGVRERTYLDHTGLVRHRGIEDVMRYSSLAQDVFALDRYGESEAPKAGAGHGSRYSDEQLYALALYLYSLQPPQNPHRFDSTAAQGKQIFARAGCAGCHTPPLYTNNKLVPSDGFEPAARDKQRFDVMDARVGTDPRYALQTHKGTGYYKVPSLKGVWYRGPLEHNGSVATLEDWFDPARLRDDYVPTGFRGHDGRRRSVQGHRFGLDLSPEDRTALLAFLRTL